MLGLSEAFCYVKYFTKTHVNTLLDVSNQRAWCTSESHVQKLQHHSWLSSHKGGRIRVSSFSLALPALPPFLSPPLGLLIASVSLSFGLLLVFLLFSLEGDPDSRRCCGCFLPLCCLDLFSRFFDFFDCMREGDAPDVPLSALLRVLAVSLEPEV